jgi:ferredoxin--NADP+ reductase
VSDLAYRNYITKDLMEHEFLGEYTSKQLLYYPVVSREPFERGGRITDLTRSGKMCEELGLPPIDPAHDRAMICGSMEMLKDTSAMLDEMGLQISPNQGTIGDYVIERAFVG